MKRISVCIVLSLVMCLCMVFPVSAATITDTSLAAKYDPIIDELLKQRPAGYDYHVVLISSPNINGVGANIDRLNVYFFNTPVVPTTSIVYYSNFYNYSTSSYTAVSKDYYSYFKIVSYLNNPVLGKFEGTVGTAFSYYVADRSTAKFVNHDLVENNDLKDSNWILRLNPDISALQSLINTAKSTIDTGYNSDSWQALQSQITAAEIFLNTTGYTQSQVDAQTAALQSALDGLVLAPALPDTTELQELLVEADKITDIGYTEPTWTRFSNARTAGHDLLARPSYTDPEVSSTTVELRTSMSALSLNSVPVPSGKGYDLATGDISGFLAPAYPMFSGYIISIRPILIGLFGILFSLKIVPIIFERMFHGFRR